MTIPWRGRLESATAAANAAAQAVNPDSSPCGHQGARPVRRSRLRWLIELGGSRPPVALETEGAAATEWVGLVGGPQESAAYLLPAGYPHLEAVKGG